MRGSLLPGVLLEGKPKRSRRVTSGEVGDRVLVKLSGGRIVEATIKAIVDTTEGVLLHTLEAFYARAEK